MTTKEAREWIATSPATQKLLKELGLPDNPQPGSLDEEEIRVIAEGMNEMFHAASNRDWTRDPIP